MVTKIYFNDIKDKKPWDAIQYIQGLKKSIVSEVLTIDLLNENALNKPFASTFYKELYPRGVYILFDENDNVRYVGESNKGFFERLMAQFDTTHYEYWGWNAMLRKMGGIRTGKTHDELTEEDHDVDWNIAIKYKLVLIEVKHEEINPKELKWLEKVIMQTFREVPNQQLLNTRIGWLPETNWEKTIEDLVKE